MMSHLNNQLFFSDTFAQNKVQQLVDDTLFGFEDGELFLEYKESESLVLDDGRIKNANYDTIKGFGLRGVVDECTAFAHSTDFSLNSLTEATQTLHAFQQKNITREPPIATPLPPSLYQKDNPIHTLEFAAKTQLLLEIDAYARKKDSRLKQVSAMLTSNWQVVHIIKRGAECYTDIRPLVRLHISVVLQQNDRYETGSYGWGGRQDIHHFIKPEMWQNAVDEALRQAEVNLQAVPAPAGEMAVILGPGWPGILLHEAIGHGLEGDFNRKKSSAFSELLGKRVAAPGVTIIDDGTLPRRRGSLTIDDEGTPSGCTVLIEDGILKNYMQDRLNARLMHMQPTGNGRRQSYAHLPLPRMTNTYMLGGAHHFEEMIESTPKGLYAVNFGGGQVDITSGKFVFSCTEAYLIENGKLGAPVKGATLIGNGPDALTKVTMIGNDMALDTGIGTCGKDGQSVPVGVGQPSLKLEGLTVGGTQM